MNLEGKWLALYVNEEQHLPYCQLINRKGKVVMVPQTRSRSSHIHHQRGIYLYCSIPRTFYTARVAPYQSMIGLWTLNKARQTRHSLGLV